MSHLGNFIFENVLLVGISLIKKKKMHLELVNI